MSGVAAVQSRLSDIQSRLAQLSAATAGPATAGTRSTSTSGTTSATRPVGGAGGASSTAISGAATTAPAWTTSTTTSTSAQGFSDLLASLVQGGAAAETSRPEGASRAVAASGTAAGSRTTAAAPARGGADGPTGEQLVAAAKDYLGVPYRWGGTDPATGLDCSGLVQRAFKDLGVDVPRVAKEQGRLGEKVEDLASARPGDLVVMDGGSHIGIYVGDGKMLHAPHTGDVVKISKVWETPTSIRRVLGTQAASSAAPTARATSLDASAARPGAIRSAVSSDVRGYEPLFAAATERYDLPAGLLAAVAQQESGGKASAVSPAGARGLMQLMPATARGLGVDPMDPSQAVDGAARLLAEHLERYDGSVPLALAAYNAGPGAVARYDGVPPYRETQQYVQKITAALGLAA